MDLDLLIILSRDKLDILFRSMIRHIMLLGYQIICTSFTEKSPLNQKDTG